ncbi:MAG: S-layer homology domain-containing protein [Oscillospiraceae bacterium]|nr:S-layer homology domain-containing protein [Oscillospiraceae bacterium]
MKRRLFTLFLVLVLTVGAAAPAYASSSQQNSMKSAAEAHLGDTASDFPNVSFDWCVYFLTCIARECGLAGTPSNPNGGIFPPAEASTWESCNWAATGVSRQINWFTGRGHGTLYYFEYDRSISLNSRTVKTDRYSFVPLPGDLVYFSTPENGSYCHVALVTEFDPGNGNIFYIGGNQDDKSWSKSHVSRRCDGLYTEKVCAVLRPEYGTQYVPPVCALGDECPSKSFTDVTPTRWYHEDLDFVMSRGLLYGTSETSFSPYATMTRGMMVSVLYRLDGCPDVSEQEIPFSDITEDTWCADAVKWAYLSGVSDGYQDGTFGKDIRISRAQAAKMLYGYACYKGLDTSAVAELEGFSDYFMLGEWAHESMRWALGSGIIVGTSDTTLTPNGSATRCQLAAIFARYLRYYDL